MSKSPKTSAALPRNFRRIRLELAREHGHPEGSSRDGYELVVPLNKDGHIDAEAWRSNRDLCRVTRFRSDEDDEIGHIVHRPGGAWAFHYDVEGNDDDEAGYRFQSERFEVGEYVSVTEDEKQHTYRVISVEHL
jgi:hypothetical protein